MTKLELIKRLAEDHNRVSSMLVKSENAILAGDTIRDLRLLIDQIQQEGLQEEKQAENEDATQENT